MSKAHEIISASYFGSVDTSGKVVMSGDTIGEAKEKLAVAIDKMLAEFAEYASKTTVSSDFIDRKVTAKAQSVIRNIIGNDGSLVHIDPNDNYTRIFGAARYSDIVKAIVSEAYRISKK